ASRYALPSERWLAPSHVTLNHGWFASRAMNCWPTMPVAPRIPTSVRCAVPTTSLLRTQKQPTRRIPCRLCDGSVGLTGLQNSTTQHPTRRARFRPERLRVAEVARLNDKV